MISRIKRFISDELVHYIPAKNKKPLFIQIKELLALSFYFHYIPYQYFSYRMYLNNFPGNIYDYIPDEYIHRFRDKLNNPEKLAISSDKGLLKNTLKNHGIPVTETLFYLNKNLDFMTASGEIAPFNVIIQWLNENNIKEIFFKPTTGGGGQGIKLITVNDDHFSINDKKLRSNKDFEYYFKNSKFECFLFEKVIRQHPLLNSINSSCVNTIRIDTLQLENNVYYNGAFIRIGVNNIVDNWSKGGLLVPINIKTGELGDYGLKHAKYDLARFDQHPVSAYVFKGTTLPYWTEVKNITKNACLALDDLNCLGWDVAITDKGPIIIETNADWGGTSLQLSTNGLRNTVLGKSMSKHFPIPDN